MINVADLVQAVKEKKEFELFDKIKFICETLGSKFSFQCSETNVYQYSPEFDDLKLYLVEGKIESTETFFQHALVRNSKKSLYFDYFNEDISLGKGRVSKYIPGEWESLVKKHYNMSLCNTQS